MVDKELLKACVVNPWSVTPRMMLIDSMIESGYSEVKALEAFEPPTVSKHLPLTYGVGNGFGGGNGSGFGNGFGIGRGGHGVSCGTGGGYDGYGGGFGDGGGYGHIVGYGAGKVYDDNRGFLIMILEQQ